MTVYKHIGSQSESWFSVSGPDGSESDTCTVSVARDKSFSLSGRYAGYWAELSTLTLGMSFTATVAQITNIHYMDADTCSSGEAGDALIFPLTGSSAINRVDTNASGDTLRNYWGSPSWTPARESQELSGLYDRQMLLDKTTADLGTLEDSASAWDTGYSSVNGTAQSGGLNKSASCQWGSGDGSLALNRVQYRLKISNSELGKDYTVKYRESWNGVAQEEKSTSIAGNDGDAYGTEVTINPDSTETNCTKSITVEYWVDDVTDSCSAASGGTASMTKCSSCGGASGGGSSPGTSCGGISSLDFRIGLGRVNDHDSGGILRIHEDAPSAEMFTLDRLHFIPGGAGGVTWARLGVSEAEIYAPSFIVSINQLSPSSYDIQFVRAGSAFVTYTISNPDYPLATNRMQITETRSGRSITTTYTCVDATTWQVVKGDGATGYRQSKQVDPANTNTVTYTRTWFNPANSAILSKVVEVYTNGPWGVVLVSQVVDPDGQRATTLNTFNSQGLVVQTTRPGGSWDRYVYDAQNRVRTNLSGWLDQGPTSDPNLCRMVVNDYSLLPGESTSNTPAAINLNSARTVTEYVLGTPVSRSFSSYLEGMTISIRAYDAGSGVDDTRNLCTTNVFHVGGWLNNKTAWSRHSDSTRTAYSYRSNGLGQVTTTLSGQADPANATNILVGTRTSTTTDGSGHTLTNMSWAVTNGLDQGILVACDRFVYDSQGRLLDTYRLDGSHTTQTYSDCCGVDTVTDREGLTTSNTYDALHRLTSTTRAGVTVSNRYDPLGRLLERRTLADGFNALESGLGYDSLGRLIWRTNALGQVSGFEYATNRVESFSLSHNPASRELRTYAADGSLMSVTGARVHGVRYDRGLTNGIVFKQECKLAADGSDTGEYTKSLTDFLGRSYKTEHPYGAARDTQFDAAGRAFKRVDADGVTTFTLYGEDGQSQTNVIDLNGNGLVDWGSDRVTRTSSSVVNTDHGAVRRSVTEFWGESGNSSPTTNITRETSVDGLKSWSFGYGLATTNETAYPGNGWRYVTQSRPDGSREFSTYWAGRLMSTVTSNAQLGVLSSASYTYDALGRQRTATDARAGTSTRVFDLLNRVISETTPAPGNGQSPQTTRYGYDALGRQTSVTNADATVTRTDYYDTGETRKTWGGRTYPVEYAYDYAGRMTSMTTWQDFARSAGAATTAWAYDLRGLLTNKVYQYATNWTAYSYTAAGRPSTRTWARGVVTYFTNDAAGALCGIGYSDGTPPVIYQADRLGRRTSVIDGAGTHALRFDVAGRFLGETNTDGLLTGLSVTNGYDSLGRRERLHAGVMPQPWRVTYGFDDVSRLKSVSGGRERAEYSYLANSSLIEQVQFRHDGVDAMTTTKYYDHLNRLTRVASATSAASIGDFQYTYNDANQRTLVAQADGSSWRYEYDSLGQVISGKKSWEDGTLVAGQQFEYAFDDIGNRRQTKAGGDAAGMGLRTAVYTNNLLNQIVRRDAPGTVDILGIARADATVTVNGQSPYRRGEYFDQVLSWNNSNAMVAAWVTNLATYSGATDSNAGRLFLPQTPETNIYDLDGNLTQDGRWRYAWDAENRLRRMAPLSATPSAGDTALAFVYDWQGRRVSKTVSNWVGSAWVMSTSTRFIYDGWNLLAEVNPTNNTMIRAYAWGLDASGTMQGAGGVGGLLWMTGASPVNSQVTTNFVSYDGNHNVMALVNAADKSVSASYEYGPFGELLRATGPLAKANPFRFSTKFQDDESGWVYYGYRYYSPNTGRWLSRDPIGEKRFRDLVGRSSDKSEQILQAYAFVENAPLWKWDVLGLLSGGTGAGQRCMVEMTCEEVCRMYIEDAKTGVSVPTVLCWYDKPCPCVTPIYIPREGLDYTPGGCPEIDAIMQAHEESHLPHAVCNNEKLSLAAYDMSAELWNLEECRQRKETISELVRLRDTTASLGCMGTLNKLIDVLSTRSREDGCDVVR